MERMELKLNRNLDGTQMVTYFPSSGEEGWPTAGVVAAATNALIYILNTILPSVFAATTSPFGYSSSPEEEK